MSEPLLLSSLPLFPLGTVLFPDGVLPLRIFEVRYLDMIGKCHRAGAPFGVVALSQGAEVRLPGAPAETLHPVGTLARIEALEQPQPGLMLVRCRGLQRFRITQQHQLRHGLWVADVQQLDQDRPRAIPEDLAGTSRALRRIMEALQAREPAEAVLPPPAEARWEDCGWVANRWCELLPLPLALKQRLMELDNPLIRLELVSDLLARHGITG
ncbi:LON peptidase substrate-binding domain-containing protein [Ramlibacter sp. 2FC]|uniref:LON peptidase substrate-binding domain-containing protein n=1 Tax=Ramlibacter sp. 2FC TaxID=2502188 RepID=UPI0010F691A2|nr:LON peptidase substrate-binding domain-containing protein [Ramlibacter sp. 2FC]